MLIAARRAQGPAVAEIVAEDISERRLLPPEAVARFARVEARRQPPVRAGDQRAERRKDAIGAVVRIVRIGAEQGEAGRAARASRDGGGHRLALALAERLLRRGAVRAAVQPPRYARAGTAADIGVDPVQVVGAICTGNRPIERGVDRQLAALRDKAAGARLAVQDGGGALDHLDPIEPRYVDLRHGIAGRALEQLETIQEDGGVEAAQLELVVDFRARPARLGRHARDEAQRLVQVLQPQFGDILARDQADRLRRFGQGNRGLRARRGLVRILLAGDDDVATVGVARALRRKILRGDRGGRADRGNTDQQRVEDRRRRHG